MGLFEEAAHLAVDAHAGSVRKGDGSPYVFHPFEVAAIVAGVSRDEEVIAAALLHDVVEDTSFSAEELRRRFGNRVADLVASETEDKREGIPPEESWRIRRRSRWPSSRAPTTRASSSSGSRTSSRTCAPSPACASARAMRCGTAST